MPTANKSWQIRYAAKTGSAVFVYLGQAANGILNNSIDPSLWLFLCNLYVLSIGFQIHFQTRPKIHTCRIWSQNTAKMERQKESGAEKKRLVVIGGGVAGSLLVKSLQFHADVTLIDPYAFLDSVFALCLTLWNDYICIGAYICCLWCFYIVCFEFRTIQVIIVIEAQECLTACILFVDDFSTYR